MTIPPGAAYYAIRCHERVVAAAPAPRRVCCFATCTPLTIAATPDISMPPFRRANIRPPSTTYAADVIWRYARAELRVVAAAAAALFTVHDGTKATALPCYIIMP